MYSNIIRAIPFSRISQVLTPDITKIPFPILHIIDEKYINPLNKTNINSQKVIQNINPLIISYSSFRELFKNGVNIAEYKTLNNHINSTLFQGYYRDITTCYIPEKQMVIMRIWFNYNRETRLIKFLNIYELCNDSAWCVNTQRYFNMLQQQETLLIPSIDNIISGNDSFIKKLQITV